MTNAQERAKKKHELKIWPEHFGTVFTWQKTFEIRLMDREYRVGDVLVLREWVPDQVPEVPAFTGRVCERTISYICTYEQKPGYAVLGFSFAVAMAQVEAETYEKAAQSVQALTGKDSGNWNRCVTYAVDAIRQQAQRAKEGKGWAN